MPDTIVLYHGNCLDGFCAAWVANAALAAKSPKCIPVQYHKPPPDVTGADVYILDFCYPRTVMEEISKVANTLTLIDHHATAARELDGFKTSCSGTILFDMARSGAGLTWDFFHPGLQRPWIVNYVEDRDLWSWKLRASETINAYIGILPYTFEAWDNALKMGAQDLQMVESLGEAVNAKVAKYVWELRDKISRVDFMGMRVPIVNAPHVNISELLHSMVEECGLAIGWSQTSDGKYAYSLRSTDAVDSGKLAKRFGGGGHAKSAGFATDFPPYPETPGRFEAMLLEWERNLAGK